MPIRVCYLAGREAGYSRTHNVLLALKSAGFDVTTCFPPDKSKKPEKTAQKGEKIEVAKDKDEVARLRRKRKTRMASKASESSGSKPAGKSK